MLNHVGAIYGAMDEVFKFADTFKEYPPRSFPPSFVPTNDHGGSSTISKRPRRREAEEAAGGVEEVMRPGRSAAGADRRRIAAGMSLSPGAPRDDHPERRPAASGRSGRAARAV